MQAAVRFACKAPRIIARDGIEALALLDGSRKIDVLFSDVVMPRMSGIELAQKARLLAPGMKIVLASGYAAEAIDDGMANGHYDFISKPYSLAQIVKKLRVG